MRDVFFQLAFAGYVGAFFNANPFLDRDGYQILQEWLREPKLKERARAQLRARLSGTMSEDEGSPVLARYAVAGLVWSVIGVGFVAGAVAALLRPAAACWPRTAWCSAGSSCSSSCCSCPSCSRW